MNHFNLGPLHFQAQTWLIVLVVIVLIATITLGVMATRRSTRPNRTGTLEGLRLMCVLFVCVMLLGPEWRTVQESDLQPEIAIVWDESISMDTEDAKRPESMPGSEAILTRRELVGRLVDSEFWKPFESDGKNRVTTASFGAPSPDADVIELAMSGTDINEALSISQGIAQSFINVCAAHR